MESFSRRQGGGEEEAEFNSEHQRNRRLTQTCQNPFYRALQLAKRGFNLALIGSKRSHSVARECRSRFGVRTVVVVKDFGASFDSPDFFDDIEAVLARLDVALLVKWVFWAGRGVCVW